MSAIKLSIIVPVYNAAPFIEQTLGTLVAQLGTDFEHSPCVEVIVIDDGSQDASRSIIEERFSPVIETGALKFHVQANQGVSAARNAGIALAQGQFIGFVDADDYVLPGYIPTLLLALESGADIVEFGLKTFVSSLDEARAGKTLYSNRRFGLHPVAAVVDHVFGVARWYSCTRVFRASLFDGIRFPVGVRFCEDLMTLPDLYEKARTVLALPDALYAYRSNPASATFNVRPDYIPNLQAYYDTIPAGRLRRHNFLRMAVAYSVYSCLRKSSKQTVLPPTMARDMRRMRFSPAVYRHIDPRRIVIQLYPTAFGMLQRVVRVFR